MPGNTPTTPPPTTSPPTASPPTASPPTASPPTASPPTASPPTIPSPTSPPPTSHIPPPPTTPPPTSPPPTNGVGFPPIVNERPIKATPRKIDGTAARGRILTEATIRKLEAYYEHDVARRSTSSSFESFLVFLLSHVSKSEGRVELMKQMDILHGWAVQLCNPTNNGADDSEDGTDPPRDVGKYSAELKHYLREYRFITTVEQERYGPFVNLANKILEAWDLFQPELESTDGMGFKRPSNDRSLILQRNDPKRICSVHKTIDQHLAHKDTQRSPDLLALPLSTAVQTCDRHDNTKLTPADWSEHARDHAPNIPVRAPEDFSEVFMSWEFKMLRKAKMPAPPTSYIPRKLSECTMALPLSLTSDSLEQPALSAQASCSNETGPTQNSGTSTAGISNGNPRKRKAFAIEDPEDDTAKATKAYCSTPSDDRTSSSKDPNKRAIRTEARRESVASEHRTYPAPPLEEKGRTVPAVIQSAIYAGERLCSSIALTHVLNAVVINEHIWLTWYERGGCVSTTGLDFITDLPHLMVLFVILKYFDDVAWGECREAFSWQKNKSELTLGNTTFSMNNWYPSHLDLFGRGTNTVAVTSEDMNPLEPNSSLKNVKMMAKIYWPEEKRQAEDELLNYAYAVASQSEHVRGHLPRLVTSGSFRTKDDPISKRKDLLQLGEKGKFIQRCLRILVFYKLKPIHELKEDEFLVAWTDCLRCHFQLWMKHLHHRDISSDNLMYDRDEKGRVVGVLNDFDLSILAPLANELGTERTGTVPFMATVLMRPGGTALPHLFEYDVESFVYVLLWITRRYGVVDGNVELVDEGAFRDWMHDNVSDCIQAHQQALEVAGKHAELLQKESYAALAEAHAKHEKTIASLARALGNLILDRSKENMADEEVKRIDRTAETYIRRLHGEFMDIIKANQVLKDAEGRQLDLSKTQWGTLAARGLAGYLWRRLHPENSNAAAQ